MTLRTATLLALVPLAASCSPPADQHGGGFPPPVVSVVTVEPKDVPVTYETSRRRRASAKWRCARA